VHIFFGHGNRGINCAGDKVKAKQMVEIKKLETFSLPLITAGSKPHRCPIHLSRRIKAWERPTGIYFSALFLLDLSIISFWTFG
jgi:hypothetical protein